MSIGELLFTDDLSAAQAEIKSVGGRITHQFSATAFVANLPDGIGADRLPSASSDEPSDLDEASRILVDAWVDRVATADSAAAPASHDLAWDTPGYDPPREVDIAAEAAAMSGEAIDLSTGTQTSLYMTGSIAVGVVVVSGPTADLKFSAAEKQKVVQEVQEGLDFLANAEPRAKITWVYDVHFEDVNAAPGPTDSYESAEGPWRNEALANMGFPASRAGSQQYVQNLRNSKGADWGYVAYFTKYPLKWFAYASLERTAMHYDNDGWGTDSINRVFAHETCHIFGAADEYGSCACGGSHGHLGIPNNNCKNCAGDQEPCLMSGNVLQMCEWSRKQIGWDESLFPTDANRLTGTYTIRQQSGGRFLDAHESKAKDYSVVTRTAQNNNTQRWVLTQIGQVCEITQKSGGRFLDAYESQGNDWSSVTRTAQNNDTQRWVLVPTADALSTYTVQQLSSGRYLDAHTSSSADFSVVTRTGQNNDSQRWLLKLIDGNDYTIQQVVNGRYLDAHENSNSDFSVVTRTVQDNDTQQWTITSIAGLYTIQQVSKGRLLDAHENATKDYSVVGRLPQHNDTQRWVLKSIGDNTYTIQQLSNGRYLDAHENSGNDYSVVTRGRQTNATQRWIIERP